MKKTHVKPLDFVILILFCLITALSFISLKRSKGDNRYIVITTDKGEFVYPLSKNAVYRAEGILGISQIQVADGGACFADSPCPNKTCVQTGKISKPGEWTACLPNRVFIRIEGDQDSLDAVAR